MFKFIRNGIKFTKWSIILAIAVVAAGPCIPVYAARIQPKTSITIAYPEEGHSYRVYQVFKGEVSSDGKNLSNVKYGVNYSGREGMALEDELAQLEAEGTEAKTFAGTVRNFLKGEPVVILTEDNSSAKLKAGYYIIIDEVLYEDEDVVELPELLILLLTVFIVVVVVVAVALLAVGSIRYV